MNFNLDSGSLKEEALYVLRNNKWGVAIAASFFASLLTGAPSLIIQHLTGLPGEINGSYPPLVSAILFLTFVVLLFAPAITMGLAFFYVKLCRGGNAHLGDVFTFFSNPRYLLKALGLRIVTTFFILAWALLFIIPGIIAAYRYSLAFYIMAQNPEMGIFEALNESKHHMNGNKMNLFILELSFIGWIILAIFTCGIGLIFLTPYMETSRAVFYLRVAGIKLIDPNDIPDEPINDFNDNEL